jgi:hypothetical protein
MTISYHSNMSHNSIHAPLNDLIASVLTAGTSLGQAVVALFHLILAVGLFGIDKSVQLVQTCVQLGFDLFRGVAGFVVGMSINGRRLNRNADTLFFAANFFVLLILGGGYYWWSTRSQRGKEGRTVKLRK